MTGSAPGSCAGCPGARSQHGEDPTSRREFVRHAASTLAVLMGAGAVMPAHLSALPVRFEIGRGRHDELSYSLPSTDGATIDREHEMILVRWQDRLYAFALSCPHQRSMLRWREQEQRFQCTKHKSTYTPEGDYVSGRATRGMDRYPLRVEGSTVHVDAARRIEQDADAAAWNAAAADLS
jgi:nitrite reductase/ring-hydroxylating ferredoxin subunit